MHHESRTCHEMKVSFNVRTMTFQNHKLSKLSKYIQLQDQFGEDLSTRRLINDHSQKAN